MYEVFSSDGSIRIDLATAKGANSVDVELEDYKITSILLKD